MRRVCMGGTFDILHIGHEALLTKASVIGDKILVGLTTDERAKKGRNVDYLNSYEIRKRNLESLLESLGFLDKFEIVPLNDDWGPSVINEDFEAIVVSEETKSTAGPASSSIILNPSAVDMVGRGTAQAPALMAPK